MSGPIDQREGYREQRRAPWSDEIDAVLQRHGVTGAVLLTIYERDDGPRIGVQPFARHELFGAAMGMLADRLLKDFDDGRWDDIALQVLPPEGRG